MIDGHRITYLTAGDPSAPPLLFVHGWLSHAGIWRHDFKRLSERYHCIAVDLLGHGDSAKPRDGDYSIPAQARLVLQLADKLGIRQFTLIGHSMGGQIALYIASQLAPARVIQLVNVAGVVTAKLSADVENFGYPAFNLMRFAPWMYTFLRFYVHFAPLANLAYGRTWYHDLYSLPREVWLSDMLLAARVEMATPIYLAGQAIHALNLSDHLTQIQAPTLTIFGEYDNTVPVADGRLAAECIPTCQLVLLKDCGHFPMIEKTEAYLEAVQKFLKH